MQVLKRVITALSTATLVTLALLFVPIAWICPVMILLVAAVHLELCQMVARRYPVATHLAVVAGVAFLLSIVYRTAPPWVDVLAIILFFFALHALFSREERPIAEFAVTTMSFFYIPWLLSWLIRLPLEKGVGTLLLVIAMVKFSDMGGFAVGKLCGRHKMCPSISPKKSWEGLAGSIVGGALMACALIPMTHYTLWHSILLGIAAALVGTLGDLVESRLKRECGVKDSATFMPAGLGGFLDMFDSLIFAPALLYGFL